MIDTAPSPETHPTAARPTPRPPDPPPPPCFHSPAARRRGRQGRHREGGEPPLGGSTPWDCRTDAPDWNGGDPQPRVAPGRTLRRQPAPPPLEVSAQEGQQAHCAQRATGGGSRCRQQQQQRQPDGAPGGPSVCCSVGPQYRNPRCLLSRSRFQQHRGVSLLNPVESSGAALGQPLASLLCPTLRTVTRGGGGSSRLATEPGLEICALQPAVLFIVLKMVAQ